MKEVKIEGRRATRPISRAAHALGQDCAQCVEETAVAVLGKVRSVVRG